MIGAFAATVWAGIDTAAAQTYSADPGSEPPPLTSVEASSAARTNGPVVLRGSRPAPQPPSEGAGACPGGSIEEPGYGCVVPNYATAPYDYGYWPYLGLGGGFAGARRHEFRHRFVGHHFARREFAHRPVPDASVSRGPFPCGCSSGSRQDRASVVRLAA
jgi:hypothetical protein